MFALLLVQVWKKVDVLRSSGAHGPSEHLDDHEGEQSRRQHPEEETKDPRDDVHENVVSALGRARRSFPFEAPHSLPPGSAATPTPKRAERARGSLRSTETAPTGRSRLIGPNGRMPAPTAQVNRKVVSSRKTHEPILGLRSGMAPASRAEQKDADGQRDQESKIRLQARSWKAPFDLR